MPAFRSVVSVPMRFMRSRLMVDTLASVEIGHTGAARALVDR
jgi:hypothetical protein